MFANLHGMQTHNHQLTPVLTSWDGDPLPSPLLPMLILNGMVYTAHLYVGPSIPLLLPTTSTHVPSLAAVLFTYIIHSVVIAWVCLALGIAGFGDFNRVMDGSILAGWLFGIHPMAWLVGLT